MTRSAEIRDLRKAAESIWESGLAAARPEACVREAIRVLPGGFRIGGSDVRIDGRLIVVGAGKASAAMAREIETLFGDRISAGLAITRYSHALPTRRIEVIEAGHPVPDRAGEAALERMLGLVSGLAPDDVVLCLLSGGASALMPAPAPGVSLEDKRKITGALLEAGATIRELNAVRKHLSRVKGGQLARWAAPARVVSLIMSDVVGDPVDFIASGPTAADTSTFRDARDVLGKYGLKAPAAVSDLLERGLRSEIPETPKAGDPIFDRVGNHVVANNRLMVDAAAARARELGFGTDVLGYGVEGEAREVGRSFASIAREIALKEAAVGRPACVLAGGETTVTVRGHGRGGRNLEMALAWALAMRGRSEPACFASVASDGTDGPTDSAGGIVDPTTCDRAVGLGLDPDAHLDANDSLRVLEAVGDSIVSGPTQTNLMDLQVLLVGRARPGPYAGQGRG